MRGLKVWFNTLTDTQMVVVSVLYIVLVQSLILYVAGTQS